MAAWKLLSDMKKISSSDNPQTILYIVPNIDPSYNAISVNINRRTRVLESLGYDVLLCKPKNFQLIPLLHALWKNKQHMAGIIIRIDGACILDKYTLIKILMPHIPLIWEIHGLPEERLMFSENLSERWFSWKNNIKRKLLSYLADAYIFISKELQSYTEGKIHIQKATVIPNFIHIPIEKQNTSSHPVLSSLLKNNYRIVLWGGSAELPWQAIDVIEKTADAMYQINKQIIFVIVGSNFWYPIKPKANILLLHPMSSEQFQLLVASSHVCLALYHKPKFSPFYFYPMKILDYMSMGKPVIATDIGIIPELIQNGYNGFLTNNAIYDINTKILKIIENPSLSRKLSQNSLNAITTHYNQVNAQRQYKALFRLLSISYQ